MSKVIVREHKIGDHFDDSHIDYSKSNAMNEEQIEAAANADQDAQPLSEDQIKGLKIRRPNIEKKNLKNG